MEGLVNCPAGADSCLSTSCGRGDLPGVLQRYAENLQGSLCDGAGELFICDWLLVGGLLERIVGTSRGACSQQ